MSARRLRIAQGAVGLATGLLGMAFVGGAGTSCQQTPTNVPLRTFERAQRLDVVCMRVLDDTGRPIQPVPTVQTQCAPVPSGIDGATLPFHLYALVSQSLRGEIAVVDMTAAKVIDTDLATPGINFLPVGNFPTDLTVSPDGALTFVATSEVNKPAVYAIPNDRILGDSQGRGGTVADISLAAWPVCQLPETPVAVTTVAREKASADGGAPTRTYEVVVVLAGSRTEPAKVITLDPAPFRRGADPIFAAASPGAAIAPGSLAACPVTSAVALAAATELPKTAAPGPRWPDGITYLPNGAPDVPLPYPPLSCDPTAIPTAGKPVPSYPRTDTAPVALPIGDELPRANVATTDGSVMYVADDAQPVIHRVDLRTSPAKELPPLLLSDRRDPGRRVRVRDIAASPTTRGYQRYLYAVDKTEGSILVFDITNPDSSPREPLRRPHPELNPLQPEDRLVFTAPVAGVSFVRYDWPVPATTSEAQVSPTGLLCVPAPRQGPGTAYGFDVTPKIGAGITGSRLRGVFGFVMLSNGSTVTLDVDDWDAPCRRPLTINGAVSDVSPTPPEDPADPFKLVTATKGVTEEVFYPVSAPHRPRSKELLKNDPSGANRVPRTEAIPQLFADNAVLQTIGTAAEEHPIMLGTGQPVGVKPSEPPAGASIAALQMSFETPEVHAAQEWQVTFEGFLPTFEKDGLSTLLDSTDGNRSLVVSQPQAGFCARGVQDFRVGRARASQAIAEMGTRKITPSVGMDLRTADYVQITDDVLPADNAYWQQAWPELPQLDTPQRRVDACSRTFGSGADPSLERDFPILEAYDDRLILTRFYYPPESARTVNSRVVAAPDDANKEILAFARRCFHDQIRFRVRAGGQWLAQGSTMGYLRNIERGAGGACVASCDPAKALLNARTFPVPLPEGADALAARANAPDRNSTLAFRNPMFSFVIFDGVKTVNGKRVGVPPARDLFWKFTTRGEFQTQSISLGSGGSQVAPQSMRFIESLGQLAVVDGSSQGLILIDLANVTFARPPFF